VRPARELLRLAAEAGETVPGKGKSGRGCWICRLEKCAREAIRRREIPRALKGKAAAPTLDRLLEWMAPGSLDGDGGSGLKT
jgi:predicted RNA-binding protein YlxR (DUF448 family)